MRIPLLGTLPQLDEERTDVTIRGYIRRRYRKIQRRVTHGFYSGWYQDTRDDTQRSIIVAGTARSGTTWLAELVASWASCRLMFEPFPSGLVADFQQFGHFRYIHPDEQNQELWACCRRVFTEGRRLDER